MSSLVRLSHLVAWVLVGSAPPSWAGDAFARQDETSGCVVCHGEAGALLADSTHARAGITCTTCHGGVAESMDKVEGHGDDLRVLRDPLESVELCGGCHSNVELMPSFGLRTDQLDQFWSSLHGQRLREGGDVDVATCSGCHGAHAVYQAADPRSPVHKLNQVETCGRCHGDDERMGAHGVGADAPALFRNSVHGKALLDEGRLSSPACSDCHGSHGTTPPRVEQVGEVCGHCHTIVQEYFERSPHVTAAADGATQDCVSCHSNHAIEHPTAEMLLVEEGGGCGLCHAGADDPGRHVAEGMYAILASLDEEILATEGELREAAAQGLFLEREHGYLDEARGLRVRASTMTHLLSMDALTDLQQRCRAMIDQTRESIGDKNRALRDRKIFTGIFFGVVLLFVSVIVIYRREVYGRRGGAGTVGAAEAASADAEEAA